jgi:hypothetical protein
MAIPNGANEAEQIMHIAFQGVELALKLTGSGTKNLAQLIYSMSKDEKNLNTRSGQVRSVQQLLKENKPLHTYQIKMDDIKKFRGLAKQYGVLFTIVKDIRSKDSMCTVILKEEEVPMLNQVLDDMGLKESRPRSEKDSRDTFNAKKNEVRSKENSISMTKSTVGSKSNRKSVLEKLQKNQGNLKNTKVKRRKKDIMR